MEEMVSVEKIRLKDIFATIKDMFSTSDNIENDKLVNEKLKKVYEIQDEIGATRRIISSERFVQKFALKPSKKKDIVTMRSEDSKKDIINRHQRNQVLNIEEEIDELEK